MVKLQGITPPVSDRSIAASVPFSGSTAKTPMVSGALSVSLFVRRVGFVKELASAKDFNRRAVITAGEVVRNGVRTLHASQRAFRWVPGKNVYYPTHLAELISGFTGGIKQKIP